MRRPTVNDVGLRSPRVVRNSPLPCQHTLFAASRLRCAKSPGIRVINSEIGVSRRMPSAEGCRAKQHRGCSQGNRSPIRRVEVRSYSVDISFASACYPQAFPGRWGFSCGEWAFGGPPASTRRRTWPHESHEVSIDNPQGSPHAARRVCETRIGTALRAVKLPDAAWALASLPSEILREPSGGWGV
jgi:hypothetical protein